METTGAVRLHVERFGHGPLVALAHGFGGSARNFRAQARALGDRASVLLYDARGHARSDAPPSPAAYSPDALVDDLHRVIADAAGPEGSAARVLVGGLSMGAATALRFALAWPERVRGLLLAAFPPGAHESRSNDDAGRPSTQAAWANAFAAAIERDGLEAAGARFAWGAESGFDPATADLVRRGFLEHAPHAIRGLLLSVLATQPSAAELAPRLRTLDVPALVIVGGRDALSLAPSRVLARALPHARLVEVPDAGHVVNLAAPRAFDAALLEFFDGIDSRGQG